MGSEQRHRIRDVLLSDDADLAQAYLTSATFKGSLDMLCAMLPSMVTGLAAQALREDGERHQMMLDMMMSRLIRPEDLCEHVVFTAKDQEKPGVQRDADG